MVGEVIAGLDRMLAGKEMRSDPCRKFHLVCGIPGRFDKDEEMEKEETALRHILSLIGDTDHSRCNASVINSLRAKGKMLNAIRELANTGLGLRKSDQQRV